MGEPALVKIFGSEAELAEFAGLVARTWRAHCAYPLLVGLRGELGSGKTTWARAMLRGLDYRGRVPSPTYTLLEHYGCGELTVVHLDLYRLTGDAALENLGLRDWLAESKSWILVEWPERAPQLAQRCDLVIAFLDSGESGRRVVLEPATHAGIEALKLVCHGGLNNSP